MSEDKETNSENTSSPGTSKTNILSWLLVIIIVTPFLIYGFPQLVGAEDALIVRSGSMEPAIQTGSVVFVYPTQPTNIDTGDVITFESNTLPNDDIEYTTHRVIEVNTNENGEPSFKTKGDANDDPDHGNIPANKVAGTVEFSIPYLGYIMAKLGTPQAIILLVMIPAALLILNEIWTITKEASSLKNQGRDIELVETTLIIIALTIFGASIATYTGTLPELVPTMTEQIQFGPTTFGITIMTSILASLIILKLL